MNDIVNVPNALCPLSYADDTNIFISGIDYKLVNIMNVELKKKIVTWLNVNKLKLNVKNTQFIIFSSGRKDYQLNNKLYINNDEINIVHYTKFLGVMVDDQLDWSHHVNYMYKKGLEKELV